MKFILLLTLFGLCTSLELSASEDELGDGGAENAARSWSHWRHQPHHPPPNHAPMQSAVCHLLHRLHLLAHMVLHKFVEHHVEKGDPAQHRPSYGKFYYSNRLHGTAGYRSFWHKMNEWYKAHGHTGVHQYLEKLFSQLNSMKHRMHPEHDHKWDALKAHLRGMMGHAGDQMRHYTGLKGHVKFIAEYLHKHRCM